jgi:hypothetical protein
VRVRWSWVLASFLIISNLVHAQIPAGVDTTRPIWVIRTIDSVGLNETLPMISEYYPPHVYGKWLKDIASCEGLPMPDSSQISKITFWMINAGDFQINGDTVNTLLGVVDPLTNRIYVSLPQVWDQETIKHELLHMLLRWKYGELYANKHPSEYFTKCRMHAYRSHN